MVSGEKNRRKNKGLEKLIEILLIYD